MILYADFETNGLVRDATKAWIIGYQNLDTGERKYFLNGDLGWKEDFDKATEIIGHNFAGFDLIILKKLFNYEFPSTTKITDTLLNSQILNYYRFGDKGHSMEVWGQYLGYPKLYHDDWSKYTPEMLTYWNGDIELGIKIYKVLEKERLQLASKKPEIDIYLEAERYVSEWAATANWLGWPFNKEKALILNDKIIEEIDGIEEKLNKVLGSKTVAVDKKLGLVTPKYPKWTKVGFYDVHTARWFGIDVESGFEGEERMVEGPYSRVEFKKLELSSSADVKLFLFRHGWIPTEWNFVKEENGKKRKTSPKITEDSLEFLGGDGKLYGDYVSSKSRYGVLKSWLENLDENSRVHGDCFTIGTPSMRSRHSGIVNIPSPDARWGSEIRELFESLPGWSFIGTDSSGNQARGLAYYLNNEEYTYKLLNEDIHTYNKDALTEVLKSIGVEKEVTRGQAKRILYAFLFGASGAKLWSYIFGSLDVGKGNKLKKGFIEKVPGFRSLLDKLNNIYNKTASNGVGWIPSIVGNKIYVDSPHKLLVYLLQAMEKITCSIALMLVVKELRKRKIPYIPLIMMHDEIDFLVPDEYAEEAAQFSKEAFRDGPKLIGVNIMDGSSKIGRNWLECH